jgi:hypothetical protein
MVLKMSDGRPAYTKVELTDPDAATNDVRCRRNRVNTLIACLDAASKLLLRWQELSVNVHVQAQDEPPQFPLRTAASDRWCAS